VSTHDKQMLHATSCSRLSDVADSWMAYDVVGIDEGQFFPDLLPFAEAVANAGKIVVVAALDGTFQRKVWFGGIPALIFQPRREWVLSQILSQPFGDVCNLLPLAESFQKFSAVCHSCGEDAPFSKRLSADLQVELIGGDDLYVPACRSCFLGQETGRGSIHITLGPMFSGKSSDLLRRIRRHRHAKRTALVVKFNQDTRYSDVSTLLCVVMVSVFCFCSVVGDVFVRARPVYPHMTSKWKARCPAASFLTSGTCGENTTSLALMKVNSSRTCCRLRKPSQMLARSLSFPPSMARFSARYCDLVFLVADRGVSGDVCEICSRLGLFVTWCRWLTRSRNCPRFAPRASRRRHFPSVLPRT
jgi:thymidine kinase